HLLRRLDLQGRRLVGGRIEARADLVARLELIDTDRGAVARDDRAVRHLDLLRAAACGREGERVLFLVDRRELARPPRALAGRLAGGRAWLRCLGDRRVGRSALTRRLLREGRAGEKSHGENRDRCHFHCRTSAGKLRTTGRDGYPPGGRRPLARSPCASVLGPRQTSPRSHRWNDCCRTCPPRWPKRGDCAAPACGWRKPIPT